MPTLLEVTNTILVQVGERGGSNLLSYPAQKAVEALRSAMTDVSIANDWSFLRKSINAVSWLTNEATLGDVQRIFNVEAGVGLGSPRPVRYVDAPQFETFTPIVGVPELYTVTSNDKVKVFPYPNTPQLQASVKFHVSIPLVVPALATDNINIPDRFLTLIKKRATYYLALSHLDDVQAAQMYERQYQEMLNQLRTRENSKPIGTLNMYKRRR